MNRLSLMLAIQRADYSGFRNLAEALTVLLKREMEGGAL